MVRCISYNLVLKFGYLQSLQNSENVTSKSFAVNHNKKYMKTNIIK